LHQQIDALRLPPDLVGEASLAPAVHLADRSAVLRQDLGDPVGGRGDHLVVGVGRQDQHDLVLTHFHLLWTGRPHWGAGVAPPWYQPAPARRTGTGRDGSYRP